MDLILFNGKICTMEKEDSLVQAIAMENGIIKAIGSSDEILALKTATTQVIDLLGKTVVPGFNDSHLHLLGYAMELDCVDLSGCRSIDDMIESFKSFIIKNNIPAGEVVVGSGWNQNFFAEKRNPNRYDLDRASLEHILIADRACHHVKAVNSAAINAYSITKDTPEVEGGEIIRDENGEPLGLFTEKARGLLGSSAEESPELIEKLILKAAPKLAEMGITSVQSDDFNVNPYYRQVYDTYVKLAKNNSLTFRVNQQCRSGSLAGYEELLKLPPVDDNVSPFYKLGPVKVMADGSLGARTAYMKEDYADAQGSRGVLIYSQEELNDIAVLAQSKGRQLAIHAIGDGAVQMAVDAIKHACNGNPGEFRHGIVHCQITDKNLLDEFRENQILAMIQPIFIHADWQIVKSRVGEEKSRTSYAFKTLMDMGVHTPFGTDCPVEGFNPFNNIYCAVTRKDLSGNPQDGYNPNEALTVYKALYCYTAEGAYASFEEDVKGKLIPGMYADMVVLSKDMLSLPADEILSTQVEMTVFNGKIVYNR